MQKQYRLCRNRQFSYVYRRGTRASCKDLTLIYARNSQKRVGFSVSKKVGSAVTRNLVKRRLRECVRPRLPEMGNGLYVIVAHPSCAERSYRQLQSCVDVMFHKLSLRMQGTNRKP
ncbi:MAG: ribonuclease P protein component [Eubacteriales bacterium]|nr:ribonuclease P protein component [Eubacteriales bacterium]